MRNWKRGYLGDGGVSQERIVDFRRGNLLATTIDHITFATMKGEEAIVINAAHIA